jgi:hypothetical protein
MMVKTLRSSFHENLPLVVDGIFDPIRVADIHRRHLYGTNDHLIARATRDTLLQLGLSLTFRCDALLSEKNKTNVFRVIALNIADLVTRAKFADAKTMLLPFPEQSGLSDDVREIIINHKINFKFQFRDKPYDLDLSKSSKRISPLDGQDPLFLGGHAGIVCDLWFIAPALKERWRAEEYKPVRAKRAPRMGAGLTD